MKTLFKKLPMLFVIVSLVASVLNVQPTSSKAYRNPGKSERVPDVLVLKVKAGYTLEEDHAGGPSQKFKTSSASLKAALHDLGVQSVKPLISPGQSYNARGLEDVGLTRTYLLRLKKSADIDAAIQVLAAVADVEFAEPDYLLRADLDEEAGAFPGQRAALLSTDVPNDPRYSEQWALSAIGAPSAWADLPAGAPVFTIAVIDSGICADHPDLDGRIIAGWDFLESDAIPQDDSGHGCSVAGVIAANMDNNIGIAGVAPNAQIMPLRVLNSDGTGSYSDLAAAIVYATDNGARVINLSLGGSNPSITLQSAVAYALSNDVVVVAAAGNGGVQGVLYPAAYPDVIAVGAVDPDLQPSSFSNYGPQVDIWAPGRDILTTTRPGGYGLVSGTSFAAPYVAGAVVVEMARGNSLNVNSGLLSFTGVPLPTETPSPTGTPTPPELPTITNTPPVPTGTSTPVPPTPSGVDPADAGAGSLYRAQVRLKYPMDLKRLQGWNVKILKQENGFAIVQAAPQQLARLARLGFEPARADSVEYMLAVQAYLTGKVLSLSDVTTSAAEMLALASVDTDLDGLTDTEEAWWCTNPQDDNSDYAGPSSASDPKDGAEVAAILRGITAYGPPFEMWPNFRPYNANGTCLDGDFDGAPDNAELYMLGTSPQRESSDKDKFDDGQELFGVTFCPAQSGPCGYGILPRAEDAAFVSANLPAWVEAPGNSPFVAAFPEPQVEVVPSSLNVTQVTVITNTKGTTVGTEKTYGTASTKGTSTSQTNTETWNNWQSVSITKALSASSLDPQLNAQGSLTNGWNFTKVVVAGGVLTCIIVTAGACAGAAIPLAAIGLGVAVGDLIVGAVDTQEPVVNVANIDNDTINQSVTINTCSPDCKSELNDTRIANGESLSIPATQNRGVASGTQYSVGSNGNLYVQKSIPFSYPIPKFVPTITNASGTESGGSRSTTSTEYEEQTISESSTNQYSDNWSTATAVDSSHAADLRFTYNIVNNGTEYAREVTSLTFNIYIGNNPNPAYTYVAVGATGQIAQVQNLFPGDELTYTSNPIALTLDEMRAIDEGAPVRVAMEDISFGQDQVFYLDALSGSVTVAMEDGYDDLDETLESYLIPVWDPSDSLQDVVRRYFPVIEDTNGNLLAVFTPELTTDVPANCVQDIAIAPPSNTFVFCKHALTGTSWWNFYLSDGLDYNGAFKDTLAKPGTSMLVRIVSDRDLDGYNDRNELRLGTDPDDPASHPAPNLLAGYTKVCTGDDCTLRMAFQNLGNYDAYGVEAILYSPDGLANITNNTIGGSGRVPAGERIVVGPSDTFQYTVTGGGAKEPVIVVSYNDPQGNHRFVLPAPAYLGDQESNLETNLAFLNNTMLPDPGVDIASTSADEARFVLFSPHNEPITDGKLFVEYIDGQGNVMHEDVFTQTFQPGPTVIPVTVDTVSYPPETTILLAFFTDSQGNILDSSARPLASFGADPSPEANLTASDWEIGAQGLVSLPDPWNFGVVEPGTTLHASLALANTGLGDLRYALSGWGNGLDVMGIPSGSLGPADTQAFDLALDTAGMAPGAFSRTLTLRTNDPYHGTISINLTGTIGTPVGTATAYKVSDFRPWDQFVYVPGPHAQNDQVTFSHTLADDPARMFPLYLYNESGTTLKGVGEYGVDFSGQSAPFGVFGDGSDGNFSGGDPNVVKTPLAATSSAGQTTLYVSNSTNFAIGNEILIIQMQGTNAGKYEFAHVATKGTGIVTVEKNLTNTYYQGGNSKAQVIRVPHFNNVSGSIATSEWDESTGGIVVFRAIVISASTINVSGKGFKGGYGNDSAGHYGGFSCSNNYATQGNSPSGLGGCNYLANGGGGGAGHDNAGSGGGGGYGADGGIGAGSQYGYPGNSYGTIDLSTFFLGSGGGGGSWGTNPYGGGRRSNMGDDYSGQGAGGVFVAARTISGLSIYANGNAGGNSNGTYGGYAGGGGSGGSIKVLGDNVSLATVQALGGIGGDGTHADGGNGAIGRIRIEHGTLTGTTNPAASTQQVNYYNITGQGAPNGVFGNGADGDLTVTTGQTVYTDYTRSAVTATASSGQPTITLSSASGFSAGQEVLIIQNQGTGAGNYEFGAIASISNNIMTLNKNLVNTYTTSGASKAQVIRVMQYHDVAVQNTGVLTAHAWDGSTGGILVFRAAGSVVVQGGGLIDMSGKGYRGYEKWPSAGETGYEGEGYTGTPIQSIVANQNGGGGGQGGGDGGGGGAGGCHATAGTSGQERPPGGPDHPDGGVAATTLLGTPEVTTAFFGGAGGMGGSDDSAHALSTYPEGMGGKGGAGGGIIILLSRQVTVSGMILSEGQDGGHGGGTGGGAGGGGGGGGGAGGSILIVADTSSVGNDLVSATGGMGGQVYGMAGIGGNGGTGRIRIEYGTLSGTTNPAASTQQVNFYNLTGSSTNTLYLPDAIASGEDVRYSLLYGQRGSNTSGGDQSYSVHLPNRQYSTVTLNALVERVAGSGSTFNFCLDIGNDGACDWNADSQPFSDPMRLDSPNLAGALNAYIAGLNSSQEMLSIPIRVNISTPADIFLFNLLAAPGQDVDLDIDTLVITPPNGNPPENIPEGDLVSLSATVKNDGAFKAWNFTIAFYQGNPLNGGSLIGSTFVESLGPGATSPAQTVTWNTAGLAPRAYTIYVKADASEAVNEDDESNNTASAPAVVKKKADLLLVSLTAPVLRAGESGQVSVAIDNEGEADVIGAAVHLYDGDPDSGGILIGNTAVDVPSAASAVGSIAWTPTTAGLHTLYALVDEPDAVLEADENNNASSTSTRVGWALLTLDAGGANDLAYTQEAGYGYLSQFPSNAATGCGSTDVLSYRQASSADPLQYRFDNLLPGRYYHLDLSFATCSGSRTLSIFVDETQVAERSAEVLTLNETPYYQVGMAPATVSLLLDPASYSQDGSVILSIERAEGLNGPIVNLIDLQEIDYCYRDSGPGEPAWGEDNHCGYDSTWDSDGFNGWGSSPAETIRFSETGSVKYKFTELVGANNYTLHLSFLEGDQVERSQRLLFDDAPGSSFVIGSKILHRFEKLPQASYTDGAALLTIERISSGDAIVSEVALEQETRRYTAPNVVPSASEPPPDPDPVEPEVTLSGFSAIWGGPQVDVTWATTTEINNSNFKLFRSSDTLVWTEIASIASSRPCGNYTGTSPVAYAYNDMDVVAGGTYYYRMQFSGGSCGEVGVSTYAALAQAVPDTSPPGVLEVALADANPTRSDSVDFIVQFSEDVEGVDTTAPFDDFVLATSGVTGASITAVSGSGDTYTVSVDTGSGNGTIRLDVVVQGSIQDLAGNPLGAGYTDGEAYMVRKATPRADFDGDGDTDISYYRPDTLRWYVLGQPSIAFGASGAIPVPADYDGDGDVDLAYYRPDTLRWYIAGQPSIAFGYSGAIPVPADYNGDGAAEIAYYRPDNLRWYVLGQPSVAYGVSGCIPVPADYDGDGDADIAYYRPSNNRWYVLGKASVAYGTTGMIPVPADYDGDGDADIAYYNPSNGRWYVVGRASVALGLATDIPVPGDYDGDGVVDAAVYRPSEGRWYFLGQPAVAFGASGAYPLPAPDTNGDGDPYQ